MSDQPVSGEGTGTLTRLLEKWDARATKLYAEAVDDSAEGEIACANRVQLMADEVHRCLKELEPIAADVDATLAAKDVQLAELTHEKDVLLLELKAAESTLADLRRQGGVLAAVINDFLSDDVIQVVKPALDKLKELL